MISIRATDGYMLSGTLYTSSGNNNKHKVLILNSATAVDKKLYHHYALFMSKNGYQVITYDYRGIAASRPKKLRGFEASFTDWGKKDFSGVIDFAKSKFPNFKILTLGHSIGGTIIGMTERNKDICGIINIGAQTAYYKDWSKKEKNKIYFLWHIFFPLITKLYGYFPGKKLGMLEDIPKGVIDQWHQRRKLTDMKTQMESRGIAFYYDRYDAKLLTLGIEDDPIGTEKAIRRIHDLFSTSNKEIQIVKLATVQAKKIGHFGFFSRKFKDPLWQQTLTWFDNI
ncbi:alpha/beta fold hydrolase [Aquimarina gracilis]|uniref:Alpha/beta fold hydrolase n=1 Tax=Aquimarina gracilis TaxID=874422 RepID=A0ABU5ZV13_9FLAO|nr:alpha/beta fold hydrolase [Aquimarina gracilis]MEB3345879.1 alpha/beta fold hydrolase [Aquimarina gracilis]